MTALSKRRERIVRVRAIEHRIATLKQTAAEKRVVELLGVARRLDELRSDLLPKVGPTSGAALQAKGELGGRLVRAAADIQTPIRIAESDQEKATSSRLLARAREEGAERLRNQAACFEEQSLASKLDADRPSRSFRGSCR